MIYLIHYDRDTRRLMSIDAFEDWSMASKAKLDAEVALLGAIEGREIVLLEAPDEASLRKTHRRYFSSLSEIQTTESHNYGGEKQQSAKVWTVRLDRWGWRVQADGTAEAHYPSKESAFAAACKDARAWNKATGNTTRVNLWREDGSDVAEEARYGAA